MTTSERDCFVHIVLPGETKFVTVGRFRLNETRQGATVGKFIYGRSYRERRDAVELDPVELRLRPGEFETAKMDGFFGAIRDAMPDSWGRRVIERHASKPLEDIDYLLRASDDRAGALGFDRDARPPLPQNKFNRRLDLERLQRAADRIVKDDPELAGSAAEQAEDLLLLGGSSMGGARPKAVVEDGDVLWIAKFARDDDRYNYPRIEHALLELARTCGLNAADSRLTAVAGRDVLLVRRFDRDRAEGGYYRYRMISALTLLRTDDYATTRTDWSYLLLADEVRRVSARPAEDLRELFGRMCLNAAISNLDDHPRNHAMLAKNQDWRLSPVYDLTPSPVISKERRDLAMECGLEGRIANKANLLSGHGRFLLNREDATAVLETVFDTVRNEWRPVMQRAGLGERECERVAGAFLYEGLLYEGV